MSTEVNSISAIGVEGAQRYALAAEIAAGPYGLTPTLFVYRDGKFVKFEE
jgi:hypothetical protein